MLAIEDVKEILSIPLLGVIPEFGVGIESFEHRNPGRVRRGQPGGSSLSRRRRPPARRRARTALFATRAAELFPQPVRTCVMRLLDLLFPERRNTAAIARDRLKIVLAHERASSQAPDFLPDLQKELLDVVGRYIDLRADMLRVNVARSGETSLLEINVELDGATIKPVKNGAAAKREASADRRAKARSRLAPALGQAGLTAWTAEFDMRWKAADAAVTADDVPAKTEKENKMATYVMIHGAYQGGWIWKPTATRLREAGHLVYAPSLDGCGDRRGSAAPGDLGRDARQGDRRPAVLRGFERCRADRHQLRRDGAVPDRRTGARAHRAAGFCRRAGIAGWRAGRSDRQPPDTTRDQRTNSRAIARRRREPQFCGLGAGGAGLCIGALHATPDRGDGRAGVAERAFGRCRGRRP